MTVLILGLGLIGASLAKTLKKNTAHCVLGWNRTPSVAQRALADGAIDATGSLEKLLPQADITIINFYPEAIVPFILEHQDLLRKTVWLRTPAGSKPRSVAKWQRIRICHLLLSVPTLWPGVRCPAMTTA